MDNADLSDTYNAYNISNTEKWDSEDNNIDEIQTRELFYKGKNHVDTCIAENNETEDNKSCYANYSYVDYDGNKIPIGKCYYIDDEVCRTLDDGSIEFGVVTQGGLSGANNLQIIWTAHNRVECQDLSESGLLGETGQQSNVALIDRKLQLGDLSRVEKNGEFGEVVNVEWMAYIKVVDTTEAIVDIRCKDLEPLLPYQVGNRIELNGWIGIVKAVESKATVIFADGKSCVVFNSSYQPEKIPYPGKKVSYSTEELEELGSSYLENGESIREVYGDRPPAGIIVFLKISSIEVEWVTGIPVSDENCADTKPRFTKIKRSQLKESVRNLDGPYNCHVQWDSDQTDLLDNLYYYTKQPGDTSLSIKDKELNMHIVSEFFLGLNEESEISEIGDKKAQGTAPVVVSVLRTCRVVDIEWKLGRMDSFRSCDVLEKVSFSDQFRQIVQKRNSLSTSSTHEYGITVLRSPEETALVKWFAKDGNKHGIYEEMTVESKYDIDYHFKYGKIIPGEIVCRSKECKLSKETFQLGIVDSITKDGKVIVIDRSTNSKESLLPFDLEVVLDHEKSVNIERTMSEKEFLEKLFVDAVTDEGENITIQESYFSPRLLRNYNLATIPAEEKFKILPHAPVSHKFYSDVFVYGEDYVVKVAFDRKMMKQFFAEGIWVIGYEDRMDLYSAMLVGQKGTPYEDGLFHFDIQLPLQYPQVPPNFYLVTSLTEPNSIPMGITPGTHHFSKLYTLKTLSLLEAILAVQKFIFETNKEEITIAQDCSDELISKEMGSLYRQVMINVLDSLFKILAKPPTNWRYDVVRYVHATVPKIISRLANIILVANKSIDMGDKNSKEKVLTVPFPVPVTKGFIVAIENRIRRFQELNLTSAGPKL